MLIDHEKKKRMVVGRWEKGGCAAARQASLNGTKTPAVQPRFLHVLWLIAHGHLV